MNAISQATIDPVTATAPSTSSSQPVDDGGVFAGIMAAQNVLSGNSSQANKNSQIAAPVQAEASLSNTQKGAASVSVPVGIEPPSINAPRHDPLMIDLQDAPEGVSGSGAKSAGTPAQQQEGIQNGNSLATASFFLKINERYAPSDKNGLLFNTNAPLNNAGEVNDQGTSSSADEAQSQAISSDQCSEEVAPTTDSQKGTHAASQIAAAFNVKSVTQPTLEEVQAQAVEQDSAEFPQKYLQNKSGVISQSVASSETMTKSSLGHTKESSKKETQIKGGKIAQEEVSPVTTVSIPLTVMANLSSQNTATASTKESKAGSAALEVKTGAVMPGSKGRKLANAVPDLTTAAEKDGSVVSAEAAGDEQNAGAAPVFAMGDNAATAVVARQGQPQNSVPNAEISQADVAPAIVQGTVVSRASHLKATSGKAKGQGSDRESSANGSDDAVQGASVSAAAPVSQSQVSAPQSPVASHMQGRGNFVVGSEAIRNTTTITTGVSSDRGIQATDAMSSSFSTSQPVQMGSEPGARNQQVEVGFHDGTLGWLSVRAAAASDNGGLHLSVTGRSNEAAAAVDRMLPSLQHFLQEHDVRAHSVSFGSQQTTALPLVGGSMASSSFSQNANNASASDQRSNSTGQQRSSSGSDSQAFSQKDRNNQPRAFPVSAGAVYEGAAQSQGLLSIRI